MGCVRTLLAALTARGIVGSIITGVLGALSSNQEQRAIEEENEKAREDADKINKMKLETYNRENQVKAAAAKYEQEKDRIAQFEKIVNNSQAAKDRMSKIWSPQQPEKSQWAKGVANAT